MTNDVLANAIAMIKSGDKNGGAKILASLVRKEPDNELAWLWLAVCAPDPDRRRQCLQQVLRINPQNQDAQKVLKAYSAPAEQPELDDFSDVLPDAAIPATAPQPVQDLFIDESVPRVDAQSFVDSTPAVWNFPEEPDMISLVCPACGGTLQPTLDEGQYRCDHCGGMHLVRRDRGKVILEPLLKGLDQVRAGVDRTASELTARRLQDEIEKLEESMTLSNRQLSQGGQFLLTGVFCLLLYLWGFRIGIILASAWY